MAHDYRLLCWANMSYVKRLDGNAYITWPAGPSLSSCSTTIPRGQPSTNWPGPPLPPTDRHRDPMTAARIHTCGRVKSLMEGAPIARSRPRVCRGLYSSKPVPGPVKMSSCP